MPWAKLDDKFCSHPKVRSAGLQSIGLHALALSYCACYLTDGFVPRMFAKMAGSKKATNGLLQTGMWEEVQGGYQIHDYLDYNPSKAEVMVDREIHKRRAAMNANPSLTAMIRSRDGDQCRYCGVRVDWRNRKSDFGGTYDHIIPVSAGGDESVDNLVVCCRRCNLKKHARTPDQSGIKLRPVQNLDGTQTESRHPIPIPIPKEKVKKQVQYGKVILTPEGFVVPDPLLEQWVQAYPSVDVLGEIRRAHAWAVANPEKAKKNWQRFLVNWLADKQSKAPRVQPPAEKVRPAVLDDPEMTPEQIAENMARVRELTTGIGRLP